MNGHEKRRRAVSKELAAAEKKWKQLEKAAVTAKPAPWKTTLESKVPEKVHAGLESAFCKGFSFVFSKGSALIEKSYQKEELMADHSIRDYAVQVKGSRKEIKRMHREANRSNLINLTFTTVEGLGLGALGVGMPDIVLFISMLLRGVYEMSLRYGFGYESLREQLLILKMMEGALSTGGRWRELDQQTRELLAADREIPKEEFDEQLQKTGAAFAMDMLLLKFIQGIPVVGMIGGAANPVYYKKVIQYVEMKYRMCYLRKQLQALQENKS